MLDRLARGTFLVLLAVMIAAWAVSMADSGAAEPPPYDPDVYWLA
jgi:hypothetical protein